MSWHDLIDPMVIVAASLGLTLAYPRTRCWLLHGSKHAEPVLHGEGKIRLRCSRCRVEWDG